MPLPMYGESDKRPKVRHVIAVAAGKGGVGKSSVSANLALALKAKGHSVGLMDTDVYGPSIRRMLPEDRLPVQKEDWIVPALSYGIEMISMAYFRRENEATMVRAPIANGAVGQFMQRVAWSPLDYLIIDFPPGTGDVQLTLAQKGNISGAVMVTTPQEVAVMDVRKAMHLFEQLRVPVVGVVENMSYYHHPATDEKIAVFGEGGGERLAREKGVPFLGMLPLDPEFARSCDSGKPLILDQPGHPMSQAFANLADRLEQHMDSQGKGLESFELIWEPMSS